ncbi:hypothetical protein NHQ30_007893 [Ciborinia camelliae]|nr:hypothetical protein NHQ30_007893 [Ciborinia camelliae]
MSLSDTGTKSIGPEELAIVGLMEAIFNLADSGTLFVTKLDQLRSRTKLPSVIPGLNALTPVKEKVEKETIQHANAESRQSVSSIIKICTFQLKYLSNRIFVAAGSPISQKTALISLFGKKKDILERVNFIDVQAKDLTRLLDYLNNVRPSPRPGPSISNPPTSLVPRVPCNDFVGRDKMLEELQRQMNTTGQVALDGPPGIGKSEICLQYARKLQDKALMKWIFWVDGRDPTSSFANIARYLGLDLSNQESPASAVLQWITKSKDESLIIVDDVDDVDSVEQSYYTSKRLLEALKESHSEVSKRNKSEPLGFAVASLSPSSLKNIYSLRTTKVTPQNHRGNLLISSKALIAQNQTMFKRRLPVETVTPLPIPEATKLLQDLIPKSLLSSKSDYEVIIKLVGQMPGSLKQAAKYIEDTSTTTGQYISELKTQNCDTPTSSDDDAQIAAIRISKTFSSNKMFKSLLSVLRSAHVENGKIMKSVDAQLLQYSSDLERVWSKRTAQGTQPDNTLPAFIKEHHKRISCLLVPGDPIEQTDHFSFASPRLSPINPPDSGISRKSSFSVRGLSGKMSRQSSITEQEKQMLTSKVTLTDRVRCATIDESKNLERFYFNEEAFGRFVINVLHDLDTLHRTEHDSPLFSQAEHISELTSLAIKAWSSFCRTTTVTYHVEWELLQVLDNEFYPDQHLSAIAAISGSADLAEIISCGEYISKFWKHGSHLLDALDEPKCQWGRHENSTKINDGTIIDISESKNELGRPHILKVTVQGSEEVQSDIAQTLAWLAAAVRYSNHKNLHESRSSIGFYLEDGALNCTINSLPLTSLVNFCKESSCWHALFMHSVLTIGYPPSKPRGSGQGLSIPFHLLRDLAKITILTDGYKGFIIQGFKFILVPVKDLTKERAEAGLGCPHATIQWHLIDYRSSDVSSEALLNKVDSGIRSVAKNEAMLKSFIEPSNHAFLGWCGKVNIHVGTDTRNVQNGAVKFQTPGTDRESGYAPPYRDPRQGFLRSNARDAERAIAFASISATAGGGGHGATGGAGAAISVSERRDAAVVGRSDSLKETLQTRSKDNIVLYDTETRRAWMVPYLNVVLHLVHLRELATTSDGEHSKVKMPFAAQHAGGSDGPAWDAIQPHLDLLDTENFNKKRLNRLNNHFTDKELRLKNALRLSDHLEYLVNTIDEALKKNVALRSKEMSLFHHSKIYGFEMEELSYAASLGYKEQKLHHTSGGWAKMRRNREQVFFCSGIGDLITPLITPESNCRLCIKCQSVPTGMDYLVAPVSCLSTCQHSRKTNRDEESHFKIQIKNSRFYEWKISEEHFSNPCPHYDSDDLDEIDLQHQKTIRLSKSPQKSNLEDFSRYMDGAVIFGQRARSGPLKSYGASFRKWMTGLTKKKKSSVSEPKILFPNTPSSMENSSIDELPSIPAVPSQPGSEHMGSKGRLGKHPLTISTASESSYEKTHATTTLSPSVGNRDISRGTTPETASPPSVDGFASGFKRKATASEVKDVEGDLGGFGAWDDVKVEGRRKEKGER